MASASIEDWVRINGLFTRYATALDSGDVEAVVDCFAEGGSLESPVLGKFSGPAGIRDFAERTARLKRDHGAQFRHVLSNLKVDVDKDRARATCYLLDFITRDGTTELLSPGEYECTLTRTGGEWRFETRLVRMDRAFQVKNMTEASKRTTPLRIWGNRASSNVQKVLWCCGELGLAFELDEIGGTYGQNRSPEYLALNPNGLVPTIDDDGFTLWESNVIVRYLSAKHGMGTLCPEDLAHRADADRWMDWQQTALAQPMGVLFRALLKSPAEKLDQAQVEAAWQRAGALWKVLDTQLSAKPFVSGPRLTMADIALGNAIHRWFRLPEQRPALPDLERWYARLRDRPAYQQHIGWF